MGQRQLVVAVFGVVVSAYSVYVEGQKREDENYEAVCDITSWSSCTSAFEHPVGTGFGFVCQITGDDHILCQKNSVYGVFFYGAMVALILIRNTFTAEILLFMSLASIIISTYLTIILFQIRNFCIVCAATHVINIILLIDNWRSRREIMAEAYADIKRAEIKKTS